MADSTPSGDEATAPPAVLVRRRSELRQVLARSAKDVERLLVATTGVERAHQLRDQPPRDGRTRRREIEGDERGPADARLPFDRRLERGQPARRRTAPRGRAREV